MAFQLIFTKILCSCGLCGLFFQGSARGEPTCRVDLMACEARTRRRHATWRLSQRHLKL